MRHFISSTIAPTHCIYASPSCTRSPIFCGSSVCSDCLYHSTSPVNYNAMHIHTWMKTLFFSYKKNTKAFALCLCFILTTATKLEQSMLLCVRFGETCSMESRFCYKLGLNKVSATYCRAQIRARPLNSSRLRTSITLVSHSCYEDMPCVETCLRLISRFPVND